MNPGKLSFRINLQRANVVGGGDLPTWTTYAQAWAGINGISARESEFALSFAATVNHKITIPFRPDVRPEDRVFINNGDPSTYRVFSIAGVIDPDNRRTELNLYVTERLNHQFTDADDVPLPDYDHLDETTYDELN